MAQYSTSGYWYVSGPYEYASKKAPTSGIATGDAIKNNSGAIAVGTAGTKLIGIALQAASATAKVNVLKSNIGRTKFFANAKNSSSFTIGTDDNGQFDLHGTTGAMGIDQGTTTNKDFTVDKVLSASTVHFYFADPYTLNATN